MYLSLSLSMWHTTRAQVVHPHHINADTPMMIIISNNTTIDYNYY